MLIIHTCKGDVTSSNENVEGQSEDEDDDDDLPRFGEYVLFRILIVRHTDDSAYYSVLLEDVLQVPLQAKNLPEIVLGDLDNQIGAHNCHIGAPSDLTSIIITRSIYFNPCDI